MISVKENLITTDLLFKKNYNLKKLLAVRGNPQNTFQVINVVGTNGKGSTANYIYKNLVEHNYAVGLFFSPAFLYQNERIQVNGNYISDVDLKRILQAEAELIKEYELTFFEIWTYIAILYFLEKKVQIAVVEAGIGGIKDSTNCFANQLAVCLTAIGLDHIEVLGDSVEKIIANKIQIAKNDVKIFTSTNNQIYAELFKKHTTNEIIYCEDYQAEQSFQKYNKAIAREVLKLFKVDFDNNTTAPLGRCTILREQPRLIIDGCHNLNGAQALVESIKDLKSMTILLASSIGKEQNEMLDYLKSSCAELFVTSFDHPRAWNLDEVACENKVSDWKQFLKDNEQKDILVCGSLYFVPQVYEWIVGEKNA